MTTVINIRDFTDEKDLPPNAIYCGRWNKKFKFTQHDSYWRNPFIRGLNGNRNQVIALHYTMFLHSKEMVERAKKELVDMVLVCWCHPLSCHCDVLAAVANGGLVRRFDAGGNRI